MSRITWREAVLSLLMTAMAAAWIYERDHRHAVIVDSVIGISALCEDGMYSTSKRDNGTCSGHGGVKFWIGD